MCIKAHLRDCLITELETRISRNPQYSLRSFARQLSIDPSLLCKILKGKRSIGAKMSLHLIKQLRLNPSLENTLQK